MGLLVVGFGVPVGDAVRAAGEPVPVDWVPLPVEPDWVPVPDPVAGASPLLSLAVSSSIFFAARMRSRSYASSAVLRLFFNVCRFSRAACCSATAESSTGFTNAFAVSSFASSYAF